MALRGDREDNQAVEDMARSRQKLRVTAEPSSCLSMSCSTFGAIKGGIRLSVMQGKAQRHRHSTGLGREAVAAVAGGTALPHCREPGLSRASLGQAAGQGGWSAAEVAPPVSSHARHYLCDGDHRQDWQTVAAAK